MVQRCGVSEWLSKPPSPAVSRKSLYRGRGGFHRPTLSTSCAKSFSLWCSGGKISTNQSQTWPPHPSPPHCEFQPITDLAPPLQDLLKLMVQGPISDWPREGHMSNSQCGEGDFVRSAETQGVCVGAVV